MLYTTHSREMENKDRFNVCWHSKIFLLNHCPSFSLYSYNL